MKTANQICNLKKTTVMTKKEEQPRGNKQEREKNKRDLPFNPDITSQDKEVLNNQSYDEHRENYRDDRNSEIDYEASDLDIPKMDEKQFNETRSKADDSTRNKKPKKSANSNDNIESQTETVYKGEKAEKYKDPSKKDQKNNK